LTIDKRPVDIIESTNA